VIAYECGWQIRKLRKKIALPGTDGAVAIGTVDVPIRIGKQTLGLQLFVSPHISDYLVLGQDVLSRVLVRDERLILTFNSGEVIDTLSEDPFRLSFEATYVYEINLVSIPETETHSVKETSEIVQSHTLESGAAPSITEDSTRKQEEEDLRKNEGVVPRMWSTAIIALSAQSDGDRKGVTDPYFPSFSEEERSGGLYREAEGAARATGEVQFGSTESVLTGGWTRFPS